MRDAKEISEKGKPRFGGKAKRTLACCSFLLFLILIVVAGVGVLTASGYTKKWVCDVVTDDSVIADKFNCTKKNITENNNSEIKKILEDTSYQDRIAAIVQVVKPSVVGIGVVSNTSTFGTTSSDNGIVGTGFVISKGLIATNHHVVSEQNVKYYVKAEGIDQTFEVKKVYQDATSDIAIVQIDDAGKLVPLDMGNSSELKVGQQVIAIGNPLGDLPGTVTSGIVSALDRSVSVAEGGFFNSTVQSFDGVIQTDAAINPGNSGGPLIDMNGKVIGINFATVQGANNLSFALPINRVNDRLSEIKQYGEFRIPYFGIQYRDRVLFYNDKMLYAAQILEVEENSPADKAGVEKGDYVVGVNGKDLDNKSLNQYIQSSKIGDKVELNIIRNQKEVKVTVTVGVKGQK